MNRKPMHLEIFFENQTEIIKKELSSAEFSVHIAVAWLNFKVFSEIILELIERKVKVNIICSSNSSNLKQIDTIEHLRKSGAAITLVEMPSVKNHMHHKFCIIDSEKILNGSFNWSENAKKSFENLMVITGEPQAAREFLREFKRLQKIIKNSIARLQARKKCVNKKCGGELVNILVYAENSSKYGELTGDIVEVCNSCYEYKRLASDITSKQLDLYLNEYRGAATEEEAYQLDELIQEELSEYINHDITIHGIGKVGRKLFNRHDEEMRTEMLWTNVFAGNKVPEYFEEETFNVYYDSSFTNDFLD